ncbi:MAG TPA: FtsX-like permease family protein, partial [Gemmatimonadales bacterium]|nr:FtsX-like permease family protein [Gemmatimonadales bacterium]
PGVEVVGRGISVPFRNLMIGDFKVPGVDSASKLGHFTSQAASPEYFEAMGTRIVHGRGIEATDGTGPKVLVVSQGMARAIWPGQDPLGKCVKFGADTNPCTTVVGVAEDTRENSLSDDKEMQFYGPIDHGGGQDALLFIRTRGPASAQVETIRRALQEIMPAPAYAGLTEMREIVTGVQTTWRTGTTMFVVFGGLALLLAAIGLYSVIAYDVAQRTHELGVRIALGAEFRDLLRLVVGDGVRFAVAGVVVGGAIALGLARSIEPLLFQVSARDPMIYGVVIGVLLMVALLASAIPAMRAAKVDPNTALRAD